MRKKIETTGGRLMSISELCAYLCLGQNSARSFAEKCGAVRRIGGRWLADRQVIDKFIDEMKS